MRGDHARGQLELDPALDGQEGERGTSNDKRYRAFTL
jgi:hypothetical protein